MEAQKETFSRHKRFVAYVLVFLFTFHISLPVYINSSFLQSISNGQMVGLIYTLASLASIIGLFFAPRILKKYGTYKLLLTAIIFSLLSLLGIAFSQSLWFVVLFFITNNVAFTVASLNIDMFVEKFSTNGETGGIRGSLLTSMNAAWVISPLITGLLLSQNTYQTIYIAAALILFPVLFIAKHHVKGFVDPEYTIYSLKTMWVRLQNNRDIWDIIFVNFILQFFYTWMVIYIPLYLSQHLGFEWDTIGLLLSFTLLPFIILQLPLGKIADKKLGEKEILSVGLLIIAVATALIPFIQQAHFWIWALILFTTRIGASAVEIMAETYFYKKVEHTDAELISIWKSISPSAFIISPLIATIFLLFFDLRFLFLFLAFIVLYGVRYSLAIKDTR